MTIEQLPPRITNSVATSSPRFVSATAKADVSVVVVTYNSSKEIGGLLSSLRAEASTLQVRVIIADNGSSDQTLEILRGHKDVIAISTGGNLGYSAGINAAMRFDAPTDAWLVLNPDLHVEPGAIGTMLASLRRTGAGIVVPRLLETDGDHFPSLRREPSLATALGEALFGSRFSTRPGKFSETVYDISTYQTRHSIEWATGAALMVSTSLAAQLGDWDERFFLYSEEIDYFRRARDAGALVLYEPAAVMRHLGGASGTSPGQVALMAANRIRYMRKHAGPVYARLFGYLVNLREILRSYKAENRAVCSLLLDESRWHKLPGPTDGGNPDAVLKNFPTGSIIIPAHNESRVIASTLRSLAPVLKVGSVEVIVACNGCTDDTAQIAAKFSGVRVLQVGKASKIAALNEADAVASSWPRLYLDADIIISPSAVRLLFEHLAAPKNLAARPAMSYDDSQASWLVRSFYRARRRIPNTDNSLWGAGAYALSANGHARFGCFPDLTGDDRYVDSQFSQQEKTVLATPAVSVTTPSNTGSLFAILRRNYRGDVEFGTAIKHGRIPAPVEGESSTPRTLQDLLLSIAGPRSLFDAFVYAGFVTTARVLNRSGRKPQRWERDESSRMTKL